MSSTYQPDNDALPVPPWDAVFLSNRDVSAQVPINFVNHAGVSVTAACFSDLVYDPVLAQECVSNLIASEFRRLVLDVYWDSGLRQYNLCPVAFPVAVSSSPSATEAAVSISSATTSTGRTSLSGSTTRSSRPTVQGISVANNTTSTALVSSTRISTAPVTSSTSATGQVLVQLGPYECSSTLDLRWVADLLSDFFQKTSDTVQAKILFFEINLHAAASTTAPGDPAHAPESGELPQSGEFVSEQLNDAFDDYIYPRSLLQNERTDLNNSWFKSSVDIEYRPLLEFFQYQTSSNGDLSTTDGWPTEPYILLNLVRVIANWGRIDPQMEGYDFGTDDNTIFPANEVIASRLIDSNGAGDLISGCFYSQTVTNALKVNNSWATTTQDTLFPALVNNITSCGISPVLNNSLGSTTANRDIAPYSSFVQAAVWNWAVGEPRNQSAPGVDFDDPESQFRCAIMDPTSAYKGHWRVADCQSNYPVACRVNNRPYDWQISTGKVAYAVGQAVCPPNTTFDVPRTGLENTYLYHEVLATLPSPNGVWLNFNSLDVLQCWVDTGPDGTCPYYESPEATQQRSVLVPTIGALIVLIVTVLTLFVKCGSNRRNSKRRKRGIGLGAWEYEGVPS